MDVNGTDRVDRRLTDVARNLVARLALTNSCPSKLRTSSLSELVSC